MPPNIKVTKEHILNKAFEIVRNEGLGSLSARRLAAELNCSTKPIYRVYENMKALEEEVICKAKKFGIDFLQTEQKSPHPFLDFQHNYVSFSCKEQQLFKILMNSDRLSFDHEQHVINLALKIEKMHQDPLFEGLEETQLKRIAIDMTIYLHGIAFMIEADRSFSQKFSEAAEHLLKTLIEWERNQGGKQHDTK